MQKVDSYRRELDNAVFAFLEEMESAATAADRLYSEVFVTRVSVSGSEEMVSAQEPASAAMWTFYISRCDNEKAALARLRHLCSQISTAIGANLSKSTPEPTHLAAPVPRLPFSSASSGSVCLCSSAVFSLRIPASVMDVSSGERGGAQEIRRMIMSESYGRNDSTLRPKKKRKVTCNENRKTCTPAPEPQKSLPSQSASKADVFDQYHLREKLEAVLCSALKLYYWSLKMDPND